MYERKRIAIIVDAPGPAEFIKPVIPFLQKKYDVFVVTVKESPAKILAAFHPVACNTEIAVPELYRAHPFDALVCATSSLTLGPFVIAELVKLAAADKKRIICFQDYWANHRKATNKEIMHLWDTVLVEDAMARGYLLEDGYQGKIVITGNPVFEKFKNVNVSEERKRIRQTLAVPDDEFVILHAGTGTPQSWEEDETTFRFFLDAVAGMGTRPTVIAKAHPRDTDPGRYERLARKYGVTLLPIDALLDDILPAVDVIVGMYSTALIHGMYLRIPCVSILLQNAGMRRLDEVSLPDFPPNITGYNVASSRLGNENSSFHFPSASRNKTGACIGVYSSSVRELKELCERIRDDVNFRKEIREKQEAFAPLPKESFAKNVADAVAGEI